MEEHVNFLFSTFGSHERAAESLGYTTRHYRKIRKKIEQWGRDSAADRRTHPNEGAGNAEWKEHG